MKREATQARAAFGRRSFSFLVLTILLAAFFMRVFRLNAVPPGVHFDEIHNGELALQILDNGPRIFYDSVGGREGLYHAALAGSFLLPLPITWKMRLPSLLFSLAGLLFSYLWVRRAFGRWAALATLGLMAVSFWTVWMGRAALRVGTVTPVAAVAAFLIVLLMENKFGRRLARWAASLALGIVLGLSFYTYRAGSMIFLLYVLFALYLVMVHRDQARKLAIPLTLAVVIALPMALIFATQPGADPRFGQIAGPWQAFTMGDFGPLLEGTVANLGMLFWQGDLETHYNVPGRPIFEPIGALLFIAGVGIALWRWRQPLYALCLLWLTVGLLPGIFTLPAPSFVHTVSAQGVVFVFPGIALGRLHRWFTERRGKRRALLTPLLVSLLVVVNGIWTFADYFYVWPELDEVRGFHQADMALIADDLDALPGEWPVSICSSVLNEEDSFWRSGRQSMPFMLNRTDLRIRWYDCNYAQVVPESNDKSLFYFPNDTSFGTWLPAPDAVPTETREIGRQVSRMSVDATAWRDALLAGISVPEVEEMPIQFGNGLAFVGYRVGGTRAGSGDVVELVTFWRVLDELPPNLAIFVHLMNEENDLIAQGDSFTVLSDTLVPGDLVIQSHQIVIPEEPMSGVFPLSIGVYSRTGAGPPWLIDFDSAAPRDRLLLTSIEIP